jgi:uncharacterized protein (TIRG00374 family)
VLALGLLALFFRGLDWEALTAAIRTANPVFLGLVLVTTLATYAARAWRWGELLRPLADVPFPRLFSVTIVGFMTGLVIPRAGEVVRPYLIARRYELKTSSAFASIILERLVDLYTVLVLFGLYLYVLPLPAAQTRGALLGVLKAGGAAAFLAATAVLVVLVLFHARAELAMRVLDRALRVLPERAGRAVSSAVRAFAGGLAVLEAPPARLLWIFGQSFVVWLSIAAGIWLNNRAFGVDLPFRSAFLIIGFLTVGVAVPTPGMVGGFHESYRLALTEAFGVDVHTAAAAGLVLHALSNLPVLVFGLYWLGREGLTFGKIQAIAEQEQGSGLTPPGPGADDVPLKPAHERPNGGRGEPR